MISDAPYGVSYGPEWRQRADKAHRRRATGTVLNDDCVDWYQAWVLFSGDVAYVWHDAIWGGTVADSLRRCGFEIRSQIIWAKNHYALSRGDYHWQHETCWYAVRAGAKPHWNSDRKQSTLWEIAHNSAVGNPHNEKAWGHGTQRPAECMRRPIEHNSKPGDTVYDPFLGSGTTLIAAEMTGRACVGLELSPAYVDVIVERWQEFTGQKAVHSGTGEYFETLAAKRNAKSTTMKSKPTTKNRNKGT